jgi:hypothetical protein
MAASFGTVTGRPGPVTKAPAGGTVTVMDKPRGMDPTLVAEVVGIRGDAEAVGSYRLDRLGRSVLHLVTLGAELRERGVELHVIEQGIDTATPKAGPCLACSACSPNCNAN